MVSVFNPGSLALLRDAASMSLLLAFDYDGTLAPIVAERDRADMRSRTLELFARVCDLYPCAIISGRSRHDVAARLGKAHVKYIFGNHGAEPGGDLLTLEREVGQVRLLLEQRLARVPAIEIEDKRYSLAVHYRKARRPDRARAAIRCAIAALPIRVVSGKQVLNLLPQGAPHKGDALLHLRNVEHAHAAFFVGDDVTDEDIFSLAEEERVFTVRVGRWSKSAARYFVRNQQGVDRLLQKLIEFRTQRDLLLL